MLTERGCRSLELWLEISLLRRWSKLALCSGLTSQRKLVSALTELYTKKKYKMTRSQLSHKEYKRHKHNSLIPAIINAFSYISKKGSNGISLHDHYQAQSNCTFSSSPIISSNCGDRNQIIRQKPNKTFKKWEQRVGLLDYKFDKLGWANTFKICLKK